MNYLFILLISILYTILFYGKVKGLSMLLFTLIFLVFTKYYLKKQDLIKNRKAFLYMIPIVLLSLTYLLFDNHTFYFLNYYAIILLYNYMVISVTNKKELFINILRNSIKLVFDSIRNALKSFNEAISIFKSKMNIKENNISDVCVFESNCYDNISSTYTSIITNPPIRAGKKIVYDIVMNARNYLDDNGKLFIVIRKEQGAKSLIVDLQKIYNVDIIAKKKGFFIIKCSL